MVDNGKPDTNDAKSLKRREVMKRMMMGGAALVGASAVGSPAMGAPGAQASTLPSRTSGMPVWNVLDFGAIGDGQHDSTMAFQTAMDLANNAGGGTVYAPAGHYLFKGNLVMPPSVTLQGIYQAPTYHLDFPGAPLQYGTKMNDTGPGTFLIPTAGAGTDLGGIPFIDMTQPNTCLRGLAIWYRNQTNEAAPIPYPWAIFMGNYGYPTLPHPDYAVDNQGDNGIFGINQTVEDVDLIFCWNGMLIETTGRPLIRNVRGTCFRRGIYLNWVEDIARLENVHFDNSNGYDNDFQYGNLEAFIFGWCAWAYCVNCFSINAAISYHFNDFGSNVMLLNCGADHSQTAIQVDACIPDWGIAWVQGQFSGQINWSPLNSGPVRFTNCSFDGGSTVNAAGGGKVTFTNCHFLGGTVNSDTALTVMGCDLGGGTINLGPNCPVATIVGNQALGGISGTPPSLETAANSSS